jgi:hypothetical protein
LDGDDNDDADVDEGGRDTGEGFGSACQKKLTAVRFREGTAEVEKKKTFKTSTKIDDAPIAITTGQRGRNPKCSHFRAVWLIRHLCKVLMTLPRCRLLEKGNKGDCGVV